MLTSRFFDPFHDFDWDQWASNDYRTKYTKQMMIRFQKIPWLQRQIPSGLLPHHFEICQLAVLHGLPENDIPKFKDHWQRTRHIYANCPDANIHHYVSSDWMTIATFDKCVAELITQSTFCQKLAQLSSVERLHLGFWKKTPQEAQSAPVDTIVKPLSTVSSSSGVVDNTPRTAAEDDTRPLETVITQWQIPQCKMLEHVRLLRMTGRERGNYIGQIGPCEYKFGLTDKDFGARTDQHLKDFDQFCLVWAQHCFNASRAEMLFKKDPRIMSRLIKRNTNKNRHREIIQIDANCTEFTIKQIYQEYVQMVNNEERTKMNTAGATTDFERPETSDSPEPVLNHSTMQMLELERQKLAFEKEKWQHEVNIRMKELEIKSMQLKQEQERITAATAAVVAASEKQPTHNAIELDAARVLCHMQNDHRKRVEKTSTKRCIEQISPITDQIIHRFANLKQVQRRWPALMLSKKDLLRSMKSNSIYKGWRWKYGPSYPKNAPVL